MLNKNIILLMNCHGDEIMEYLNRIPEIYLTYNIKLITTYQNLNNENILEEIKICDILITNNIKNYKLLNFDNIIKYTKPECNIIKIEWIRFNGFWLYEYDKNHVLFNYDESINNTNTFYEFINYNIESNIILDNFNKSLEKLISLQ
jgi:hypothetical protein